MPRDIDDEEVNRIARELAGPSKSIEAEAAMPKQSVANSKDDIPIRQKLAKTLAISEEIGPYHQGDHKTETDELWVEEGRSSGSQGLEQQN